MSQLTVNVHGVHSSSAYSQAVVLDDTVWCSGVIGYDVETGALVGSSIREQAEKALANLERVLIGAGASLASVVCATVHMIDLDGDSEEFNDVWTEHFAGKPPARTCVQVVGLALGARVEITVEAFIG